MNLTWKNGLVLFLSVILASAIGCAVAFQLIRKSKSREHQHQAQLHAHVHEVLQRDLGLSADQIRQLEEIEEHFLQREAKLKAANVSAVAKLADALERDRSYSPQVDAAIAEIHQSQGELQKATIEHLLEMQPVLSSEQYDQLLELVAEALRTPSSAR